MVGERTAAAFARIDRALARIEAAAPASAGGDTALALAELEVRHRALKQETQRALAELDALVVQSQAGGE